MIDSVILLAVIGNGVAVVIETTSGTTGRPDDKLGRGVVGNRANRAGLLSLLQVTKVTIPATVEGVVGNTIGGGHDLRADLNRDTLDPEAVIHHTGVEHPAGIRHDLGVERSRSTTASEDMVEVEEVNYALTTSRSGKVLVDVGSERDSTSLRVVHLNTAGRGGVVPAIRAAHRATVGATAAIA